MFVSLIAWSVFYLTFFDSVFGLLTRNEVECVTKESPESCDDQTGCITSVTCDEDDGYVMTGCTSFTEASCLSGSWIDNPNGIDTCYANRADCGQSVKAYARCCKISIGTNGCLNVYSEQTLTNASVECSSNQVLTGCSVDSEMAHIDGVYPGQKSDMIEILEDTQHKCTAQAGLDDQVYATGRCCEPADNVILQCYSIWGEYSENVHGSQSQVSCPNGLFLAGCMPLSEGKTIDGAYFSTLTNDETCIAQCGGNGFTGDESRAVRAIAICCVEYEEIELIPPTIDITEPSNAVLPGANFFSYAFNLLQGKPAFDLLLDGNYQPILTLSFNELKVTAGSKTYSVPDQLDIPALTGTCITQSKSSAVTSSSSTAMLFNEAGESSMSESGEGSVEAGGYGFSGSASVALSASHSNSYSASKGLERSRSGQTEYSYTFSKASLYNSRMRWNQLDLNDFDSDFIDLIGELDTFIVLNGGITDGTVRSVIMERIVREVIGEYGTHVLKKGSMGARCVETIYFKAGQSSEAYSKAKESVVSKDKSFEGSASGSYSGGGVDVSVSGSYARESGNSYSNSVEKTGETAGSFEYSKETTYCSGELDMTMGCGGMLGGNDQPALSNYQALPLSEIDAIINNYPFYSYMFEYTIKEIFNSAVSLCGGIAIPGANYDFWNLEYFKKWYYVSESSFEFFWDPSICFDQFAIGTVMLTSGSDITSNPINHAQASSGDTVTRRQYKTVEFSPFCFNNDPTSTTIVFALTSFTHPRTSVVTGFGVSVSTIYQKSFLLEFYADGRTNTIVSDITVGSANYLILCDEISGYIFGGYITFDHVASAIGVGDVIGGVIEETVSINIPDNMACDASELIVRLGFKQILTENAVTTYSIDTSQNTIDVYGRADFVVNHEWDVSYIVHCPSDRIVASGSITFEFEEIGFRTENIEFESGVYCRNTRVWLGISEITNPDGSVAMWVDNLSKQSFDLVVGIWPEGGSTSYTDSAVVEYLVLCSGN